MGCFGDIASSCGTHSSTYRSRALCQTVRMVVHILPIKRDWQKHDRQLNICPRPKHLHESAHCGSLRGYTGWQLVRMAVGPLRRTISFRARRFDKGSANDGYAKPGKLRHISTSETAGYCWPRLVSKRPPTLWNTRIPTWDLSGVYIHSMTTNLHCNEKARYKQSLKVAVHNLKTVPRDLCSTPERCLSSTCTDRRLGASISSCTNEGSPAPAGIRQTHAASI